MINHFKEQVQLICKVSAAYFEVEVDDIYNRVDEPTVNRARKVAMYLAREITEWSFPKLAKEFKRRNHTTVMSACRKMKYWVNTNAQVRGKVMDIKEMLEGEGVYDLGIPAGFQILKSS